MIIMIAIYNINSNLNMISGKMIEITQVINKGISEMKPILTENWRGVRMGNNGTFRQSNLANTTRQGDMHAPYKGCQFSTI